MKRIAIALAVVLTMLVSLRGARIPVIDLHVPHGSHVLDIPLPQTNAIRRVRKTCEADIWVQIRSGNIRLPLYYVGRVTHSAQMGVRNGLFVDIADTPQDVSFNIYGSQGWSDDPYNHREGDDGWIFGSSVTVRADILTMGFNLVNSRDLSCKVSARA